MPYDTVDRGSVEKMVREFYAILIQDDIVGPYFIKALGDDLKNDKWYEHFKTLDNFWLMMMNGDKGYMGDPFFPHVGLGELYPETFQRWLDLFNETVHNFFIPEIAEKFYKKGETLAKQFQENLAEDDDDY